ncbi:MAG: epoxyqueuosine reductase [Asgard group archaeon]|nr:epoxyqueuosine reductase [Asgard group archaeon]
MIKEMLQKIEENGYKYSLVSVNHLKNLQLELENRHKEGLFDEEFYQERILRHNFNYEESFPEAKSIIIVAIPDPQYEVTFNIRRKRYPLRVPPTYMFYQKTWKKINEVLNSILHKEGFRAVKANLPLKSLSVHSGLAKYGRNNITYVPGMGSFHVLAAFYTDLPCEEENWKEYELEETCKKCSACLRNCPTGAISSDRFLLFAEKCLSYLNEKPGNIPFPERVDPSWHNCLVGCTVCQLVCPLNKEHKNWIEKGLEFSEEETKQFLQGLTLEEFSLTTKNKLLETELDEYLDTFPRNLNVLIRSKE